MDFSGANTSSGSGLPFLSTYRVSITTISDIRYEGTLYQVNPEKKNIVLTNVVSFGTEGRIPGNEIMGSNAVHDSIVFEGKDIKDLVVLENSGDQLSNANVPPSNQVLVDQQPQQQQPQQPAAKPEPNNVLPAKTELTSAVTKEETKKTDVFDFELMNEKFQKLTLKDAKTDHKEFGKYSKTSFFDNISNSTTEKNKESKEERLHQNQIDKETFGQDLMMAKKNQKFGKNNQNYKYKNYRGGYKNQSGYGGYNYSQKYSRDDGNYQPRAHTSQGQTYEKTYESNRNYNYESGGRNYESGGRNYESGGRNYESGGRNYESGGRTYESGGRNYESGGRNYESGQSSNNQGYNNYRKGNNNSYHYSGSSGGYGNNRGGYHGNQSKNYQAGGNKYY